MIRLAFALLLVVLVALAPARAEPAARGVTLDPASTRSGYIALLLINEVPFPGERAWVSEADSKAAMLAILWVLHSRIAHVPPGYRQEHIATVRTSDIIDVITAGGEHGQVDGFHRDRAGRFVAVSRVHERVAYLLKIANDGRPGRFARLLDYAQGLARAYDTDGPDGADRYARLHSIGGVPVTGRAYSWMTDRNDDRPGGNYVRIPDADDGGLGGNRFFTLRKLP